jgi:excisionase family DNA binding protein
MSNYSSTPDPEPGLMTPAEVAAILHIDAHKIARWSDQGRLRSVRTPGGHRRYFAADVLALAQRRAPSAAQPRASA